MVYRILADVVLIFHLGFVIFVVLGGLLVLRWRRLAWLHVPAAVWGALIELAELTCPLTPLENELRQRAGEQAYAGGFIEHYIVALLYPGELTDFVRVGLGLFVLAINGAVYGWIFVRSRRKTHGRPRQD
jgi:hypothetical protein